MSAAIRSLAFALLVVGCATGGKDGGGQPADASVPRDSSQSVIDAPRLIDAPILVDAGIDTPASMIDAPSGPFCSGNSDCTVSGECCVTLGGGMGFCAAGDIVFGTCFPQ
jgi:hypothetical protein